MIAENELPRSPTQAGLSAWRIKEQVKVHMEEIVPLELETLISFVQF